MHVASPGSTIYHLGVEWPNGRLWTKCEIPRAAVREITSTDGLRPCSRCPLPDRPAPVVYFASVRQHGHRRIKIGTSRNVPARLAQLTRWFDDIELLATTPGWYMAEHDIHRRFADSRYGRWETFEPTGRLLSLIGALRSAA